MEYLDQPTAAETGLPTENSLWGHRKGDAILLAWNYARERGDLEAAAQLHLEYEKIVNESPPIVSVDRREKTRGIYGALVGFGQVLCDFRGIPRTQKKAPIAALLRL